MESCPLLGRQVEHPGAPYVEIDVGGGVGVEFDEVESVALPNSGSPGLPGGPGVATLGVGGRDDVDQACRLRRPGRRDRRPDGDATTTTVSRSRPS